jgi:predicted nucleic acid-binding Zn ribbon protein
MARLLVVLVFVAMASWSVVHSFGRHAELYESMFYKQRYWKVVDESSGLVAMTLYVAFDDLGEVLYPKSGPPSFWRRAVFRSMSLWEVENSRRGPSAIWFAAKLAVFHLFGLLCIVTAKRDNGVFAIYIQKSGRLKTILYLWLQTLVFSGFAVLLVNYEWVIWWKYYDIYRMESTEFHYVLSGGDAVGQVVFSPLSAVAFGGMSEAMTVIGGLLLYTLLASGRVDKIVREQVLTMGCCLKCGYPMGGKDQAVCSECGRLLSSAIRRRLVVRKSMYLACVVLLLFPLWYAWVARYIPQSLQGYFAW